MVLEVSLLSRIDFLLQMLNNDFSIFSWKFSGLTDNSMNIPIIVSEFLRNTLEEIERRIDSLNVNIVSVRENGEGTQRNESGEVQLRHFLVFFFFGLRKTQFVLLFFNGFSLSFDFSDFSLDFLNQMIEQVFVSVEKELFEHLRTRLFQVYCRDK